MIVELAVAGKGRLDLAFEKAVGLCLRKPLMAFGGINVGLFAGDAEEMADDLRRLAHVQFGDGIG